MFSTDDIAERWVEAIQQAYDAAYLARMNMRKGRHIKTFDVWGVHTFSEMVGRILAFELIAPDFFRPVTQKDEFQVGFSVIELRQHAEDDADRDFVAQIREETAA